MNTKKFKVFLSLLLAVSLSASAEDIDLFVGVTPAAAMDYPNVVILIDNTSNWAASNQGWPDGDKQGRYELDAINTVLDSLAPPGEDAKINLGLMLLGDTAGAYVRSAVRPMTSENREALKLLLTNIDINSPLEKAPSSSGFDLAMFEVFKYFGGYTSVAHATDNVAGVPVSFDHFGPGRYSPLDPKADSAAYTDNTKTTYVPVISPASASCAGKNYVIMIGNGWVPFERNGNSYIGDVLLGNVGGNSTQIYTTSPASLKRVADEMSRFLNQTDVSAALGQQNVITYAIDVYKNSPSADLTALLKSMSEGVGGGKYYAATSAELIVESLGSIISEIQSTNSVFASVSLPVSVNTQGTYLNQVFIGMFRPDKDALPRWFGNLKQYKLGRLTAGGPLKLLDAGVSASGIDAPVAAVSSSGSGFIAECARSSWTPLRSSTADGYWSSFSVPNCVNYPSSSNTPDGNMVEKGGHAYKLRAITPSARVVKTCGTCADNTALENFVDSNTATITKAALGDASMTNAARTTLINWARGLNSDTESIGVPAAATALTIAQLQAKMRPSSHGDVVHSRPVAINYAATDTDPPQVVVYYGGNDGMLRAVNGNRDGGLNVAGVAPGDELWSFVAPDNFSLFARNKSNSPKISFPYSVAGTAKSYGFDGPVTAYKTASTNWIYAVMRRGGSKLYAFDVSIPGTPVLKWQRGVADMPGIGQTWSEPTVLKSAGYAAAGVNRPMLIMGGGYDNCQDVDPPTSACKSSGQGRAIYLLDADTGAVLQTFTDGNMGGVIADITVVANSAGLAQYAYAADLNGNVYRISGTANTPIGAVAPGSWALTRIAALAGAGTDARKFMFAPDVVLDSDGSYVILLGSGDREKPLTYYDDATAVSNYFFMLRDHPANATWLTAESANCLGVSSLCLASLTPIAASTTTNGVTTDSPTPTAAVLAGTKGWYLAMTPSEQVVTSALTIFGTVNFSTHMPAVPVAGSCSSDLGNARSYRINFKDAAPVGPTRFTDLVGDGLPPSPVAGLVKLDDGSLVPFCIGCSALSPLEGGEPITPATASQPKAKVFWNIER